MKWSLLDDFSSQFLLKRQTFLFFSFSKTAAWLKYRKNIVEPLVEWEFVASMSRQKREPARYGLWNVEATVGIADDPVIYRFSDRRPRTRVRNRRHSKPEEPYYRIVFLTKFPATMYKPYQITTTYMSKTRYCFVSYYQRGILTVIKEEAFQRRR